MIRNTFCHLPGVGPKTERFLWLSGVRTWDSFLSRAIDGPRSVLHAELLEESERRVSASDPFYFSKLLPAGELWRIFPEFRHTTCFLDIETNGRAGADGYITTIATYDGADVRTYVRGENLDDFPAEMERYKVIVTYNGRCFDVPMIESAFGLRWRKAHIDLRFILASLGFKGGLKGCEKALGIERDGLDGVDGFFAVLLWQEYRRRKNPRALETLLAYNVHDAVNLERLMVEAYNRKLRATPFEEASTLRVPDVPQIPFGPDDETVRKVFSRLARFHRPSRA